MLHHQRDVVYLCCVSGALSDFNLTTGGPNDLTVVTLHGNKLTGSLAPLAEARFKISYLTLSGNDFTGRVPELPVSGSNVTLMLHQNRLSCQLPSLPGLNSSRTCLVLPGNRFGAPVPSWVTYATAFLTVPVEAPGASWFRFSSETSVCVVLLIAAWAWYWFKHVRRLADDVNDDLLERPTVYGADDGEAERAYIARLSSLVRTVEVALVVIATLAALLMVPATVLLGGGFYECGDPMLKVSCIQAAFSLYDCHLQALT